MERMVDFPQPEWPMTQTNSPLRTRNVQLATMTAGPCGVS